MLDSDSWLVFNSALGIMLLGAAGSLLPLGRRVLGGAALVVGIALLIPFADFVALLLTGIWIIATSILQFRGSLSERGAAAESPGRLSSPSLPPASSR